MLHWQDQNLRLWVCFIIVWCSGENRKHKNAAVFDISLFVVAWVACTLCLYVNYQQQYNCVVSTTHLYLKYMKPKKECFHSYFFTHFWKKSNKTYFPFIQSISTYCTPLILIKMHHIGIISWRLLMSFWL